MFCGLFLSFTICERILSIRDAQNNNALIAQSGKTYSRTATGDGGRVCVRGAGLAFGRPAVDSFAGVVASVEVLEARQSISSSPGTERRTYPAATVVVADAKNKEPG